MQHRAKHHTTNIDNLEEENNHIKKVLTSQVTIMDMGQPSNKKKKGSAQQNTRTYITPWSCDLTIHPRYKKALARKMKKARLMVHNRPHTKLRELLVKHKLRTNLMTWKDHDILN